MAEQQSPFVAYNNALDEYNKALDEVTGVIREQFRLIDFSDDASEYKRRINREITKFADTWGVVIRIEVRSPQVEDQPSTTEGQGERPATTVYFEAPRSQRFSPIELAMFMKSLPPVARESLEGDAQDKRCNICFYPFFEPRGAHEAEAICNGIIPRPNNMNQEPHEVRTSDLPERPLYLPCGHIFGHICVEVWITRERGDNPPTCPNCREIWRPAGLTIFI
ncbi:hypothetical protein MMC31_000206 [Peltigera leucophlebia]|nr:hypothetical protein [Peltigera leucophlebia]